MLGKEQLPGKKLLTAVNWTILRAHTGQEIIWVHVTRVKRPHWIHEVFKEDFRRITLCSGTKSALE